MRVVLMKIFLCILILNSFNNAQNYSTDITLRSVWANYCGIVYVPVLRSSYTRTINAIQKTVYEERLLYELEIRVYRKNIEIEDYRELIAKLYNSNGNKYELLIADDVKDLPKDEYQSLYYELKIKEENKGWYDLVLGYYLSDENDRLIFEVIDKLKVYFF